MFSIKTAAWFVPSMLIPIVCGQPCEIRNGLTMPFSQVETGFFGETGIDVVESFVVIQGVSAECDASMQQWSLYVDVSGDVGVAELYPRSQTEISTINSESHDMVWSFHPTEGDWSRFTAELMSLPEDPWEPGATTQMRCDEASLSTNVWVYEVFTPDGQLGDCVIVGADAMTYSAEFPNCSVWGS